MRGRCVAVDFPQKMIGKQRHIACSFKKRRKFNRQNAQTVKEIGAKFARVCQFLQIGIARADHANIRFARFGRTDAPDFARLQNAQKTRLKTRAGRSQFIEKNRAAVRCFKKSGAGLICARERSLLVSEKLGFEQSIGQARTIN